MGQSPGPNRSLAGVSGALTFTHPSLVGVLQQVRLEQAVGELAAWSLGEGGRIGRALRVLGAVPHQPPASGSCPRCCGEPGSGCWDPQALDSGISRL